MKEGSLRRAAKYEENDEEKGWVGQEEEPRKRPRGCEVMER